MMRVSIFCGYCKKTIETAVLSPDFNDQGIVIEHICDPNPTEATPEEEDGGGCEFKQPNGDCHYFPEGWDKTKIDKCKYTYISGAICGIYPTKPEPEKEGG